MAVQEAGKMEEKAAVDRQVLAREREREIMNLMRFWTFSRREESTYRGNVLLRFSLPPLGEDQQAQEGGQAEELLLSVCMGDDGVHVYRGMPPSGNVNCEAAAPLHDFLSIYAGTMTASEIAAMLWSGKIRVDYWKIRELGNFGMSFSYEQETWDEYYDIVARAEAPAVTDVSSDDGLLFSTTQFNEYRSIADRITEQQQEQEQQQQLSQQLDEEAETITALAYLDFLRAPVELLGDMADVLLDDAGHSGATTMLPTAHAVLGLVQETYAAIALPQSLRNAWVSGGSIPQSIMPPLLPLSISASPSASKASFSSLAYLMRSVGEQPDTASVTQFIPFLPYTSRDHILQDVALARRREQLQLSPATTMPLDTDAMMEQLKYVVDTSIDELQASLAQHTARFFSTSASHPTSTSTSTGAGEGTENHDMDEVSNVDLIPRDASRLSLDAVDLAPAPMHESEPAETPPLPPPLVLPTSPIEVVVAETRAQHHQHQQQHGDSSRLERLLQRVCMREKHTGRMCDVDCSDWMTMSSVCHREWTAEPARTGLAGQRPHQQQQDDPNADSVSIPASATGAPPSVPWAWDVPGPEANTVVAHDDSSGICAPSRSSPLSSSSSSESVVLVHD